MGEHGLQVGTPGIESVGPIAFGPDDVLFVADNVRARIVALDVHDTGDGGAPEAFDLDDLDPALAAFLGCDVDDVVVRDLAVHPRTHNVYLSVMRGRGNEALPVIVRIDHRTGALTDVALTDVAFADVAIDHAIRARRRAHRRAVRRRARRRRVRDQRRHVALRPHRRRVRPPSPTWPTSTASSSSPACRTRSSRRPFVASRSRSPTASPTRASRSSTCRTASGRRRRRSARSSRSTAGRASWPATRARRSCTSRSRTSRRAPRRPDAPSPSWVR